MVLGQLLGYLGKQFKLQVLLLLLVEHTHATQRQPHLLSHFQLLQPLEILF